MTKKIFKSTVLVSAMILILGSVLVMGILYRYFGKQLNGELEKEASYLAYGVEQSGVNYLEHLKQKDARITLMRRGTCFMTARRTYLLWKTTVTVKSLKRQCKKVMDTRNECPVHCLKKPFIMHGSLQMEQLSEWL